MHRKIRMISSLNLLVSKVREGLTFRIHIAREIYLILYKIGSGEDGGLIFEERHIIEIFKMHSECFQN